MAVLGATTSLATLEGAAHAFDGEVTSDTTAQFYDMRSPTGEVVLSRRRLTSTLGVGGYEIMSPSADDPMGPILTFRARLRYDADYGASPQETDATNLARFVPGFDRGPVDLMYGYVEGRRFAKGWLNFKIGRQYVTDALGWYSFDGGEVKVVTPYYFAAEAYGGLEVRGGLPLSSPRYEADGVWRGDRSGYDHFLYPSFQPANIAPTVGVALESTGVTWLHGRLTYRRTYNTGQSNVSEFASGLTSPVLYDGPRISQERLGYSMDATWADHGGVKAGVVYDLYRADVTSAYASLDAYLGKKVTVSLDYDYYQPSFDGDSIWNFFAGEPMNDLGLRGDVAFTDRLSVSANAHARIYNLQTAPYYGNTVPGAPSPNSPANYYPSNGMAFDEGGGLAGRYKWGQGLITARASGNWGDGGERVGGDVSGERIFETRYVVHGRLSLWQWDDKLRPDRDATSFGYVAGLGYRFAARSQAGFDWEHNMNRLVGQRFRVMLWLNFAVTK